VITQTIGIVITLVKPYWLHSIIFKTARQFPVSTMLIKLMKTNTAGYGHTKPYSIVATTVTLLEYYTM
jgi:hypothetical protein